ncbi:hypothetical protein [Saccharopolyspora shandongensis]|uniref:hypothetical protein n=1 Tax=Saccharopolyspora shandongensis TaxID=418495 RepID=UPI0033FCB445
MTAAEPFPAEARASPTRPVDDITPRKSDSAAARSASGARFSSTCAAGTAVLQGTHAAVVGQAVRVDVHRPVPGEEPLLLLPADRRERQQDTAV